MAATLFSEHSRSPHRLLVSAIAVRGFTNERSEFLLTTLPVVEPAATPSDTVILPHFAEGGGWTTQVVLVNPGETASNGAVNFFNSAGQIVRTVPYFIAPRSAMRIPGAGTEGSTQTGSIRIVPGENTVAPSATSIFSFVNGNATVTVAGLPAIRNGTAFRLYVEAIGATQSGLAIANPSSSPVSVDLELMRLDGSSTGLSTRLNLPRKRTDFWIPDRDFRVRIASGSFPGRAANCLRGARGRHRSARPDQRTPRFPDNNDPAR